MTARECFNKIMNFERADRMPILAFEPYEQDVLIRWQAEGMPGGAAPQDYFGMDSFAYLPVMFRPLPAFDQSIISETDEEYVQLDVMGSTVRRKKEAPSMYYGHIDHPVKDKSDWDCYKELFKASTEGRYFANIDASVDELNASEMPVGLLIFPFFFRLGFYSMGLECFLTAFYDTPCLIHEMFEYWSSFVLDSIRPFLSRVKIDFVAFGEDLAYKTGPHISPSVYKEFWLPYQDPLIKELKSHGAGVISQYSAGNLEPLLPFMIEHGFNAIWPLERGSGMDPVRLRKEYGRDLSLAGGVSKEALIIGPSAIDREMDDLGPIIQDGGFIPGIDDMVPPEVPLEHYRYFVESVRGIRL